MLAELAASSRVCPQERGGRIANAIIILSASSFIKRVNGQESVDRGGLYFPRSAHDSGTSGSMGRPRTRVDQPGSCGEDGGTHSGIHVHARCPRATPLSWA